MNRSRDQLVRLKPCRDDEKHEHKDDDENTYCYQAKGGSWVYIPTLINPYSVLQLQKNASVSQCKAAFGKLIATPDRQQRVMVSYAAHMLSDSVLYVKGEKTICDVFDYAISGDMGKLAAEIERHPSALDCCDTSGRTLLYIAARSGFYDTCEFLLKRGARVTSCGSDSSTPLHAASFYGHGVVCLLLVSHGASVKARNKYGNTPIDEARIDEIRQQLLGTTEGDRIMSLMRSLNNLVTIENVVYKKKLVAKVYRHDGNQSPDRWMPAWHGTRFKYVASILKNGLKPSGSHVDGKMIKPPRGHYQLGSTHFGISNWANAVFISPNLLYAGHPTYSERVVVGDKQWCVVICVVCRPGSYASYPSTITQKDPVDGEPGGDPEWRVDVEGDDMIWRHNETSNIMVTGIAFVDLDFFDDIGHGIAYRKASNLLHPNCS